MNINLPFTQLGTLPVKIESSCAFFIMPVFLFEKVVYLRNLFSINSVLIFTLPLVFFPFEGAGIVPKSKIN